MRKKEVYKNTLAKQYLVDVRTFNTWIKKHLDKIGLTNDEYAKVKKFTPLQVVRIYECLGEP
ncbi:DUF4248 domain-containing protein [Edaphocola aurantiacus]|uniref:DUF4248 domain-containing protein n=1 Tax=Edaphocola aurantiacus TaxID=2601682 RepID=UPI001C96715B|nr:DUF4248 domain-containing protein [Edaphocola aurantiacus]